MAFSPTVQKAPSQFYTSRNVTIGHFQLKCSFANVSNERCNKAANNVMLVAGAANNVKANMVFIYTALQFSDQALALPVPAIERA